MNRNIAQVAALLGLSAGLACLPVRAEPAEFPPTKMYATAWGLTLARDGTGFYNELARFVLGSLNIDYEIRPYRRAMRHFFENPGSCLFPKSVAALVRTNEIPTAAGFINSIPVQKTFVAVFTPTGTSPVHGPSGLNGKRVAYAMGSKVPEYLGAEGAFFIAVADEVDKAEMLLSGRVDVLVANLPDAGIVYNHLGAPLPPFDPDYLPFPAATSRFLCHDTPGSQAFMDSLNKRLRHLHSSGELAAFYQSHGLEPSLYLAIPLDD